MNWEVDNSSQVVFYTGKADGMPRAEAMREMLETFEREVLPKNKDINWDCIRTEIWADSGRFIIFPISSQTENRIEKAGCQVIFSDLLESYNELADSDVDDDIFCDQLSSLLASWNNEFINIAKSNNRLSSCRLLVWDADSEEILADCNM